MTLFAGVAAAQTNADRIIDYELANSKAYETLSYLTDHIGPRLSGSKNADLAVKWAMQTLRGWGIDVHNEPVMVPHWVRGAEHAQLVSHNDRKSSSPPSAAAWPRRQTASLPM